MNARSFYAALLSALAEGPSNTTTRTDEALIQLCGCTLCASGQYPLGNPAAIAQLDDRIIEVVEEQFPEINLPEQITCADLEYQASRIISGFTDGGLAQDFAIPFVFEWGIQLDPNVRQKCECPGLSAPECKLPSLLCILPAFTFGLSPFIRSVLVLPIVLGLLPYFLPQLF